MTTTVHCPACLHSFGQGTTSGRIQCPQCSFYFEPSDAAEEPAESYDFEADEFDADNVQLENLASDEGLETEPVGTVGEDDEDFWLKPDESNLESDIRRKAAMQHLQAAQDDLARVEQSQNGESFLDQIQGQAASSTRHFQTIIAGFVVMFVGLVALARVAGHYTQGRTGSFLPMLFMAVAAVGICIIVYGIGRGVVEMVTGLFRGKRRS
jgi:hypothetical protein